MWRGHRESQVSGTHKAFEFYHNKKPNAEVAKSTTFKNTNGFNNFHSKQPGYLIFSHLGHQLIFFENPNVKVLRPDQQLWRDKKKKILSCHDTI